MFLKTLEMQGFKSFPDKIKLNFNRGLTAVVGPNGSGKSNVSDAIRWVLGEQSTKTLRGSKMEDVIFIGTQKRKSQGFAEVSLTIDNTSRSLGVDSDIVTITRKYYRNGDSEYLINNNNVRLKDINELFMDTGLGRDGYSMIGQGRIAEIVSAKSGERRQIFEEASGITKYRYRKNESEKKLEQAEENLVRLRDILSELEGRVEPLRIQSEKAKKFLTLAQEKKTMEISLWMHNLEAYKDQMRDEETKLTLLRTQHSDIENEYEQIENSLEDTFAKMQQALTDIDNLRRQKEELESQQSEINSAIAVMNNDILHNNENIERISLEIEQVSKGDEETKAQIAQSEQKIENIKKDIEGIDAQIAQKEQELLELTSQDSDFSQSVSEINSKLNLLTLSLSQHQMRVSSFDVTSEKLVADIENAKEIIESRKQELSDIKSELDLLNNTQNLNLEKQQDLENSKGGYTLKLNSRMQKQETAKADFEKIDNQVKEKLQRIKLLEDLEKNMEGFAYSVKTVLGYASSGMLSGILGTVSQLINVPSDYTVAIETALGGAISNIVVQNDTSAKQAIKTLKEKNVGRATFLPLNTVKGNVLDEKELKDLEGYIGIASKLISFDSKYQNVMDSLLGRIAVVTDLDCGSIIAKKFGYKFKIVTLDGQVINAGGSFTGGSQNKSSGVLSRKSNIEKLEKEVKDLDAKKSQMEDALSQVTQEVEKIKAEITAIDSEILVIEQDKIRFESEQKRLEHSLNIATEQLELAQQHEKELSQNLGIEQKAVERAKLEIESLQKDIDDANAQMSKTQESYQDMGNKREEISALLSELSVKKAVNEKEVDSINQAIALLNDKLGDTTKMQTSLHEQLDLLNAKNTELSEKITALENSVKESKESALKKQEQITQISEQRNTLEASTTETRATLKELSLKREKLGTDLAKAEEKKISIQKDYDVLIAKLWEEYQLTRSSAQEIATEVENVTKLKAQLADVKGKIKALGNINVEAIEEYEEVSTRYNFMSQQIQDVEKSKTELLNLIEDLTKNMYEIFSESFVQINKNFNEVFVDLFGGGHAELVLTEPDNVLESGIEIKVAPPGKIIKNLSSLSGGEQAFIAIAIYFAILKIRPAPFCVLDEIEAALDDVNVAKYAHYLKNLTDKTQFILITHRRGTMENADILYGVTMQEEGVSKLLELNISDLESKFKTE